MEHIAKIGQKFYNLLYNFEVTVIGMQERIDGDKKYIFYTLRSNTGKEYLVESSQLSKDFTYKELIEENDLINIRNKINSLQLEIDMLKRKEAELTLPELWRATKYEKYFYLDQNYDIKNESDTNLDIDNIRYYNGNYFKDFKQAEDYKENLIVKATLKKLAAKLNKGIQIDWRVSSQAKYYIYVEGLNNKLCYDVSQTEQGDQIYCLDPDFLKIAKTEIGEDKLIKMIKSGI